MFVVSQKEYRRFRIFVVFDGDESKCSSRRIGSTAAQHPKPTEDSCCDNTKIIDTANKSEMGSIKLSKRGTEDERILFWSVVETARPPSGRQEIFPEHWRIDDCFCLFLVVRYLLGVGSTAQTRERVPVSMYRYRPRHGGGSSVEVRKVPLAAVGRLVVTNRSIEYPYVLASCTLEATAHSRSFFVADACCCC